MIPALTSLLALQHLDTAADTARRRLAELPAAEREIDASVDRATEAVTAANARFQENRQARRELEKDVAVVDTRLSRFDEHKAAVKTNHEYTALLHEIAAAKAEKDAVEERILILLEAADLIEADIAAADAALAELKTGSDAARRAIVSERTALEAELATLADTRRQEAAHVETSLLAKYDQLLKLRRSLAVVPMVREVCAACHVRLRPAVTLQVRRNDTIVQCDSCQRILYFVPDQPQSDGASAGSHA